MARLQTADINVTPLIDVLLVLLIIFMAALPLTQKGLDVDLPLETGPQDVTRPNPHIVLEYTADRRIAINHQPVTLRDLEGELRRLPHPPRKDDVRGRCWIAPVRRHRCGHRRGEGCGG